MMPRRMLLYLNVFRTPVAFHWSIVLLLLWALFALESPIQGIMFSSGSVLIILIHEIGHSVACRWRRYNVRRIVVHILGGFCEHETAHYRGDQIAIALGGVAFQALLAGVSLLAFLITSSIKISPLVSFFLLTVLVYYNLFIIILNLIPFPGFDGSEILEAMQMPNPRHRKNILRFKPASNTPSSREAANKETFRTKAKPPKDPTAKEESRQIVKELWGNMNHEANRNDSKN
jgi:stage IV sporulation protein FB